MINEQKQDLAEQDLGRIALEVTAAIRDSKRKVFIQAMVELYQAIEDVKK